MCKISGCNNRVYCKGVCDKHYKEIKKYGRTLTTKEKCQIKLQKYDNQIEYISGYKNCNSIVKCYCNRCKNTFERKWCNITRSNTEYSCPICQTKLGMEKSKENIHITPLEERQKNFLEMLKETQPHIIYRSGFVNSKSIVSIRFKKCNHTHQISVDRLMRKNKPVYCQVCIKEKKKETNKKIKELIKIQKENVRKIEIQKRKEIRELYRKIKENTVYINKCVRCNEEYIGKSTSKYCPKCRHIIRNSHSSKSLKKLYDRDKGICKICNGICNWNDKKIVNGTTIVGNTYPSIDHIIPLSKGGSDDWENLQLAHFKCNWLKGAC